MRTGMHMTIQDYFRQSGIQRGRHSALKGAVPGGMNKATPFARALSASQASATANSKGWTLQDYQERPIHIRRRIINSPVGRISPAAKSIHPEKAESTISSKGMPKQDEPTGIRNGRIQASIKKAAKRFDLPPALIEAVIKAESDFNARAVSPAGAQGLMQLMPATASELGVENPFDVDQNIQGGARYLRNMLDRFKGDIKLALSAYNAGPGTVAKYKGNVPYPETQKYIQRVMKYSRQLSSADQGVS